MQKTVLLFAICVTLLSVQTSTVQAQSGFDSIKSPAVTVQNPFVSTASAKVSPVVGVQPIHVDYVEVTRATMSPVVVDEFAAQMATIESPAMVESSPVQMLPEVAHGRAVCLSGG